VFDIIISNVTVPAPSSTKLSMDRFTSAENNEESKKINDNNRFLMAKSPKLKINE
jgi:hypothetical protein